jgi:hypothetical protein
MAGKLHYRRNDISFEFMQVDCWSVNALRPLQYLKEFE